MSKKLTEADFDIKKALAYKLPTSEDVFDTENPITYALSIGFSRDGPQEESEDLKYTYELHDDYTTFPTYGAVIAKQANMLQAILETPGIPAFNPMALLHGEQRCEMYKPLIAGEKYISEGEIIDIQDKGKGLLLANQVTSYDVDSNGKKADMVFRQKSSVFIRGLGGSKFKGTGHGVPIPSNPKREHDYIWEEKTTKSQAILYRLTGDKNPLHVDPGMAAMGGFDTPILHGMNFYALAAKAVIKRCCDGNETQLSAIQARFVGHVFPGETIVFRMWRENGVIIFDGKVVERGTTCIKGFAEVKSQPKL